MNDLEPWKIWSITGALVCLILGSTAARVGQLSIGGTEAHAASLYPNQLERGVSTSAIDFAADQNDAYSSPSSYTSRSSYNVDGYSSDQLNTNVSRSVLPASLGGSPNQVTENEQEPALDVTRQLYDGAASLSDLIAANSELPPGYFDLADFTSNNSTNQDELNFLASGATLDASDYDQTYSPVGGPQIVVLDQSGTGATGTINLALGNMVLQAAGGGTITMQATINGVVSNVNVNFAGGVSDTGGEVPINGPVSIDQPVAPDSLDEAEDLYEVQTQAAIMAEREETIAQDQAALIQTQQESFDGVQQQKSAIIRAYGTSQAYFVTNLGDY